MKQGKQFLRPLLMAIVMLVGMLVPQEAWAEELRVSSGQTMTITRDANYETIFVGSGSTLIIEEGVSVSATATGYIQADGTVINYGTINGIAVYEGATFANHGYVSENIFANGGTIYNTGTYVNKPWNNIDDQITPCGHTNCSDVNVEATCTHDGGTQTKCNTCYYIKSFVKGSDALGHIFDSHKGINTCTRCGLATYDAPEQKSGYYQIANAGNLYWFADKVNKDYANFKNANAKLTADIVVNDITFDSNVGDANSQYGPQGGPQEQSNAIAWPGIGNVRGTNGHEEDGPQEGPHEDGGDRIKGYEGIFDGQGHTISGLYSRNGAAGLVEVSAGNCIIKNVGVVNSYFLNGMGIGVICKVCADNTEISNCYSNAICEGDIIGGIVGNLVSNQARIKNCYSTSTLSSWNSYDDRTGGIVGQALNSDGIPYSDNESTALGANISNCYTTYKQICSNVTGTNCEASVSADRFASGEIAYKLNGSTSDGTQKWYQAIGTDAAPVFVSNGSNTVYEVDLLTCSGENAGNTFANANEAVTQPHDYHVQLDENEKPGFVWSENNTSATLQLVCSRDEEHTAGVEVTLGEGITSAETTTATCATAGVRTYTATATYKGETYTETKEVEIAALGHNFVNGVCEYCSVTQLTYISGSEGVGTTEGAEKLIDGDDDTKWCSDWSVDNKPYIIFKAAAPASISGYNMVHGDDTHEYTGRAWATWTIYGANFESDEEATTAASEAWQEVDSRSGYNSGSDYSFSNLTCESYQYYKIVIDSNVSGKLQQMAEIHFTLSCVHSGDKIEHSASEATAEYHGNGGYKVCAQCGACLDAEGNVIARPVIHYFDEEHTHARIEPTCTAVGSIAYKECVVCNKFFDMDNNPVSSTVLDMIEHTFDSDGKCTKCQYVCEHSKYSSFDSDTHRCTICQQSKSHTFDETGICEVCGGYLKPEGEGTEQSPYLIANKGNILWFNNSFNDTHLKLVADVAITGPITVSSGKALTMNLDGHALTGEGIDIFSVTGGTLNLRDAESNDGKLTKGDHGVMITEGGIFNMYGGSITECTSANAGVAVNVKNGTFNMYGGAITGNQVGTILNNRGVVYVHPNNGYFNMQGGSITNNSGKTYGVGVYCVAESDGSDPSDHDGGEACFAAGTLVTMADGSKKAIEDVAIGESVLTMNHDTGEMTAETVFFVHDMEMDGAFTLHFSNGTDVTVVKYHDFFEKENNRYVTLATQNASSYIGRSFYCAESNEWVELTGVTPIKGTVGTYGLLVAHTFNNLANGMLTAIMPPYPVYNAFEFGDNLIIDQEKKAADIALYGIMDYEEVKDAMSREFFDTVNGQYARVLIGKGMATLEDCLRMVTIYFPQNNAKQSAHRRAGEVNTPHVTLSGKVIISGNKKTDDNSPSNLAVSEGMLSIGTLEAGSMIGIDLCMSNKESENSTYKKTDRVYGVVASDAVEGDVQYFTADNPLAGITYNEGKLAIHQHSFDNKTLTAEPVADGLYAYACDVDGCGAHTDDHIVKNGEGENTTIIELTDDGEGNFSAASVDIADGVTFQAPVAFTVSSDKVTVKRTFTAEKPASVMLPFSIDASLISGATFHEFKGVSYDSEKSEWVATMQAVSTVEAYKPYLVILKADNETGKVTFDNNFADVATFIETPDASNMQTADENGWTFKAVNANKTWGAEDTEIGKAYGFAGEAREVNGVSIAKGEFVKLGAGATAAPGRCYLVKEGALAANAKGMRHAAEVLPSSIKVRFINGEATGIATLNTETGELILEGWYDLNGRKINAPAKGGIYVKDGKKVLVK